MVTKSKITKKPVSKLKTSSKKRVIVDGVTFHPELVKIGKLPSIPTKKGTVSLPKSIPFRELKPFKQTKAKPHPLQWKGSYMKEDTVNKENLRQFYGMDFKPLHWFEMFIGQLIYAISEKDFLGWIEVVNKEHASKLSDLQGKGYTFSNVLGISERLAGLDKAPAPTLSEDPLSGKEEFEMLEVTNKISNKVNDLDIQLVDLDRHTQDMYREFAKRAQWEFNEHYGIIYNAASTPSATRKAYKEVLKFKDIEKVRDELLLKAKSFPDEVLKAIDTHLFKVSGEEMYSGILYQLVRMVTNCGKYSEADEFLFIIKQLKQFLFNPDNSSKFFGAEGVDYTEFTDKIDRLEEFFIQLGDSTERIELQRLTIDTFPSKFDFKSLSYIKNQYSEIQHPK